MKLAWTPEALAGRRAIYDCIEADDPRAALALDELISERTGLLTNHPHMGRPGRVKGTRELPVHRRYVLIYDIAGEIVRIPRVLHTARRWPPRE